MKYSTLLFLTCLVAGCASAPQLQSNQPKAIDVSGYVLSNSALLDRNDHMTQTLDKTKNLYYFQNYGGGGAGLGLLLGPFGVLANMKMIEANTKKEVDLLTDKIHIDSIALFSEASRQEGWEVSVVESSLKTRITPYLYISKVNETDIFVSTAMILELGTAPNAWTGKYMYQLPVKYSIDDLSHLNSDSTKQLASMVENGFAILLKQLHSESQERLLLERNILFKSEYIYPRFGAEMLGNLIADDGKVVWIKTTSGVFGVQKTGITYSMK